MARNSDGSDCLYKDATLNAKFFGERQMSFSDLFQSQQHFFTRDHIRDGDTFLDVGGGGGEIASVLEREVARIHPTILDPDPNAIASGRQRNPHFTFIQDYFPSDCLEDNAYDFVSMQALFPQIPDWKPTLLALSKASRRTINISVILRLQGNTVIDKDVSYAYYLDSGTRVHQVIHNIYELYNFCCLEEMNLKKISFWGYRVPRTGHNFRCVPACDQIQGALQLEVFPPGLNPKRMGAASDLGSSVKDYRFFVPETEFIIDGEPFSWRE